MKPSEVTLDWLLEQLSGVEGSGTQYQAWCPCHDDEGTSRKGLSITQRANGKVYCKCWSCSATLTQILEQIEGGAASNGAAPMRVTTRAVSTKKDKGKGGMAWWVQKTGVTEDVWEELGCVEHGSGVAFVFEGFDTYKKRTPPKGFEWHGTQDSEAPPLWPIPGDEVAAHIWITESESDAGTAVAAGNEAYASTKGAKAALPAGMYEELRDRGCREVTFAGDGDDSGDVFNARESSKALAAGLACNIVSLRSVLSVFSGINDLNAIWRECETIEQYQETIDRATTRAEARFKVSTTDEMNTLAEQDIEWIIPGLITYDDKILCAGPPKSYKTWILLDLVKALVDLTPFLNRQEWVPPKQHKVLLVQEEGSKPLWAKRIKRLNLQNRAGALFIHRQGVRFTDQSAIDTLIAVVHEHEIDFVVLDPLQRMIPGINENDSSATGVVWDEVMRMQMQCPGLVVCVVHHASKGQALTIDAPRGSSRHSGEVDLLLLTEKIDQGKVKIAVHGRDIPEYMGQGESLEATIEIEDESYKIDANEFTATAHPLVKMGKNNKASILESIREGSRTLQSIVSATNLSESTVRRQLKEMSDDGTITEHDHGMGKAKTYEEVTLEQTGDTEDTD